MCVTAMVREVIVHRRNHQDSHKAAMSDRYTSHILTILSSPISPFLGPLQPLIPFIRAKARLHTQSLLGAVEERDT